MINRIFLVAVSIVFLLMFNLHDGHAQLVHHARGAAQRVVVSIFVNP